MLNEKNVGSYNLVNIPSFVNGRLVVIHISVPTHIELTRGYVAKALKSGNYDYSIA